MESECTLEATLYVYTLHARRAHCHNGTIKEDLLQRSASFKRDHPIVQHMHTLSASLHALISNLTISNKVREIDENAPLQNDPLSHVECIVRIMEQRKFLDALLQAPYVTTAIFLMDWLHCADQGITADFMGNLLFHFESRMPGSKKEARYNELFLMMQRWYEANNVQDRMDCLKPTFIEDRAGMKLRASAAKVRALVPFCARLCNELGNNACPIDEALRSAANLLVSVYNCLSSAHDDKDAFKRDGLRFASLYIALHDRINPDDDRRFRLKPKLHLFLHLCLEGGDPAKHWCYRDESFGGTVAKVARRRGGLYSPEATSLQVLQGLQMGTPRICIR